MVICINMWQFIIEYPGVVEFIIIISAGREGQILWR